SEGPAVVPGKSSQSLLLQVAAHQKQPVMPPEKNERKAVNFTAEELGLLKLWIDQGAKGNVTGVPTIVKWQAVPSIVNPIYAVAITPDAQYAACGRANHLYVFHLPTGKLAAELVDPALAKGAVPEAAAHLDLIQSLAFNPQGDLLASGAFRDVKLWRRAANVKQGETLAADAIKSAAVSANDKWAAIGDNSGKIKVLDLASGSETKTLEGHAGAVTGLRFTADGSKLLSGSLDKSIRLWNLADGKLLGKLDTPAPINAVAFLANDAAIATAHADNLIRLWPIPAKPEGEAPMPSKELKGHTGPVNALSFAANQLISGSDDGTVRFWNLDNGQPIKSFNHGGIVTGVAFRPDGKRVVSVGATNSAKLWNVDNSQQLVELKGDLRAQQRSSAAERMLAIFKAKLADQNKAVTEAQERAKKETEAIAKAEMAKTAAEKAVAEKIEAAKKPVEAKQSVEKENQAAQNELKQETEKAKAAKEAADKDKNNKDLAKAADEANKKVAAAETKAKGTMKKLEDAAKPADKALQEQKTAETASQSAARGLDVSKESAKNAAAAVDKAKADVSALEAQVKQHEADAAAAKKAATETEKPLRCVAFAPDGLEFYVGGDDKLVHAYGSETGGAGAVFEGHTEPVLALTATPAGPLSGSADKNAIRWIENAPWTLERTIGGPDSSAQFVDRVLSLDFSPDGKLLATGGGEPSRSGELKLWNVADGSLAREIKDAHSDTIFCVRFSPDGNSLASSAADRFMKVFSVADGHLIRTFEGHTHHVLSVTWKADGKWLATGSADTTVKVWDFATGEQKKTIQGFGKEVTALASVGSSLDILTGSGDKSLKLMNMENGNASRTFENSGDFVFALAVSADGKTLVAGGQDGTLREFNIEKPQPTQVLPLPKLEPAAK
ncbi:MAG TPA: hypothetical protein VFE24_01905, partial [Pirellulales bacterium]|nr:hypothetical protein [Pirellulales bacterium]